MNIRASRMKSRLILEPAALFGAAGFFAAGFLWRLADARFGWYAQAGCCARAGRCADPHNFPHGRELSLSSLFHYEQKINRLKKDHAPAQSGEHGPIISCSIAEAKRASTFGKLTSTDFSCSSR